MHNELKNLLAKYQDAEEKDGWIEFEGIILMLIAAVPVTYRMRVSEGMHEITLQMQCLLNLVPLFAESEIPTIKDNLKHNISKACMMCPTVDPGKCSVCNIVNTSVEGTYLVLRTNTEVLNGVEVGYRATAFITRGAQLGMDQSIQMCATKLDNIAIVSHDGQVISNGNPMAN